VEACCAGGWKGGGGSLVLRACSRKLTRNQRERGIAPVLNWLKKKRAERRSAKRKVGCG
jgi:hypothetical protein